MFEMSCFSQAELCIAFFKHSLVHTFAMLFTNTARGAENNPVNEDAERGHGFSQNLF